MGLSGGESMVAGSDISGKYNRLDSSGREGRL